MGAKLTTRIERLEAKANPPGKVICFIQDLDNPDLYTSLDNATGANHYNLTKDQARAMTRPQDNVIWLEYESNTIRFEGPDAEEKRANLEAGRSCEDE